MNVMLVAISQRRSEIGLLKALGALQNQVIQLILFEAMMLAALGAVLGLLLGELGCYMIRTIFPELPAYAPLWALLSSVVSLLASAYCPPAKLHAWIQFWL